MTQISLLGLHVWKLSSSVKEIDLKRHGNIFYSIGLLIRIFKVTILSVVKFFITSLVSEILKDKDTSYSPFWIFKNVHDVITG